MTFTLEAITCPYLLVVEGKDEENFFKALLRKIDVDDFQVLPIGGKTRFHDRLKALRDTSKFQECEILSVGIVRDSDGDKQAAFDSVCSALAIAGLPVPSRPMVRVRTNHQPDVSVMIMPPEEAESGQMLEDLCLAAMVDDPGTSSAMHCVDDYFKCLGEQADISHKINALPKARIHAFLASRPDPELRLGEAAQRGYFPLDNPVFDCVKAFLTQLAS